MKKLPKEDTDLLAKVVDHYILTGEFVYDLALFKEMAENIRLSSVYVDFTD